MKFKNIYKFTIVFIVIFFVVQFSSVNAAVQSNGDTPANKDRNSWMVQIRQTETTGGGFGLDETINDDLTPSSGSNNIDVHMQKNTEYGAMALLSASAYGKPEKIEDGETTTGNETGVVISYNFEWVADQYPDWFGTTGYNNRYINYYISNGVDQKIGDAYLETKNWHGSSYVYQTPSIIHGANSTTGYAEPGGILRNYNGIFGFYNKATAIQEYYISGMGGHMSYRTLNDLSHLNNSYKSRLVVVNGEGV